MRHPGHLAGLPLRPPRRFQKGVGVAAAMLIGAGVLVLAQRDDHTLGQLRAILDPAFQPDPAARDHHKHPWTVAHFQSV